MIVDEARKWLGVRFRHQGRCRQGVDCAGLLYVVYSSIVGPMKDFYLYPRQPQTSFVFRSIRNYADRIEHDAAQAGDVVLLNFGGSSIHFGIFTGNTIIHADTTMKKVVEHSLSTVKEGRAVAFFKWKGCE